MILNLNLASCVGDAAEAALMPHTDGILLVGQLVIVVIIQAEVE